MLSDPQILNLLKKIEPGILKVCENFFFKTSQNYRDKITRRKDYIKELLRKNFQMDEDWLEDKAWTLATLEELLRPVHVKRCTPFAPYVEKFRDEIQSLREAEINAKVQRALKYRKRRGRPPKLKKKILKYLPEIRALKDRGVGLVTISRYLAKTKRIKVSPQLIHYVLKQASKQ